MTVQNEPRVEELRAAADRARDAYNTQTAISLYSQAIDLVGAADRDTLVDLLMCRVVCHTRLSNVDEARSDLESLRNLAEETGDARQLDRLLLPRAAIDCWFGLASAVRADVEPALDRARRAGDTSLEADLSLALALAWRRLAENDHARETGLRALDLYQTLGNQRGEAESAYHAGVAAYELGQADDGRRLIGHAREIAGRIGYREIEAQVLSTSSLNEGDLAVTRAMIERAEATLEVIGSRIELSRAHNNLALIYRGLGLDQRASEYAERAVATSRSMNLRSLLPYALETLGQAYLGLGRLDDARD
ncbi:MAG: hypothetical protein ACRDFS_12930, partial [Chloroflexota bacterium]